MAGLFVFEGPDSVGKTTIINEVETRLQVSGRACVCLSFPGKEDGTLGAHVYKLHHDLVSYGVQQISPLSLQLLHVAAHVDTIERRILPLIHQGATVLLDRYWWSTMAYGIATGIPKSQLETIILLEKMVWRGVVPATLFMLSRAHSLGTQSLLNAYADLVEQESSNYPVICIKNEDSVNLVAQEITQLVLAVS